MKTLLIFINVLTCLVVRAFLKIYINSLFVLGSGTCALHLKNGIPTQTCSVPLVVKGSLDYEMENEYIIWVGVTDPGGVTHKQFRIEVENVNERPTDILISDDRVPENSPGGTVVGEFLVCTIWHCFLFNILW